MSEQPKKENFPSSNGNFKWRSDELDDFIMKRIYETYNIKGDSEESDEDEDQDEGDNLELNASSDDETYPMLPNEPSGSWEHAIVGFWESLSTASKLLTFFTFLWPLSYFIAKYLFADSTNSMDGDLVPLLLVVPSGTLMGINGLLMLFNQNKDEVILQEHGGSFRFIVGALFMLIGWGVAVFFTWRYFVQAL